MHALPLCMAKALVCYSLPHCHLCHCCHSGTPKIASRNTSNSSLSLSTLLSVYSDLGSVTENRLQMGHNSDKLYVTHSEHAAGSHSASTSGKQSETGRSDIQRLPL